MIKKPTLAPFGIAKQIEDAAINRLGVSLARTHLLAYAKSKGVEISAVVSWLHQQIETSDLSDLTSEWGWNDDAEQKVSKWTVRRFITSGAPGDPDKLRIYLAFLVAVGFFDEKNVILSKKWEVQLSRRPKSDVRNVEKVESDLRFLVGLHYGEFSRPASFEIKSFWFAEPRADEEFCGDLLASDRRYDATTESATDLDKRIDDGRCDEHIQMLGSYWRAKGNFIVEFGEEQGYSLRSLQRASAVCSSHRGIKLNFFVGHQGSEHYEKIGSPYVSEQTDFPNLTKRQKNNIMGRRPRFVTPKITETIRRLMSNELSQADVDLLEAAQSQNALAMMVALHAGANINAVDPANGQTALHYVAQGLDPFSFTVLAYEPEYHEVLLDAIKKDTELDPLEVDHSVRKAQLSLDPLILDHEHKFASERADPVRPPWEDPDEVTEGPIAEMRELIYGSVHYLERGALEQRGLSRWLNNPDVVSMDERLAQMGLGAVVPKPGGMD